MRIILILIIQSACILSVWSQKADSLLYVQIDFANRWVWRGVRNSEVPTVFPIFGYKSEKINLSIHGAYPFQPGAYSEINFTFEYQCLPLMKLGITDYFAINDSLGAKHRFFDMNRESTRHMFDFYTIIAPFESVPISFTYSIWVWGEDRDEVTLKQRLSQYLEVRYDKAIGRYTASAFAGFTPARGYYASGPAIVNSGVGLTREFKISEQLNMPLKIEFVLNPEMKNAYLNAIISFK